MNWWRHVMAMELRKFLAYRSDFWITFVGQTLVQLVIARALWQNVFESQNVTQMNGFNLEMMTLYYLIIPIGMKMISGENVGFIAREIYDGTFSRYLIYPLSAFRYKTITYLTHTLFYGVQLILILLAFKAFFGNGVHLDFFLNLLLGVFFFFVAACTYLMMAIFIELLALWADNIWSLMVMLRFFTSFFGGGFIPLVFFPEWARNSLAYTPFPYLVSLPTRTIMGQTSFEEMFQGILILMCWLFVAKECVRLLWARGQKQYTGVGQ